MQVFVVVCVCCVCVRVSPGGADRPAGKQAGWSLISPVGADIAAPAGLSQRKDVLYMILKGNLLFSFLLVHLFHSPLQGSFGKTPRKYIKYRIKQLGVGRKSG